MAAPLEVLVGGALEKSQTKAATPRAREELQIALERVRGDAELGEIVGRLLRTSRAAPLGERKFVLFGLGRVFEEFGERALQFAGPVARFVSARLGDDETLSDSTYCQVLCKCCTEVATVCGKFAKFETRSESLESSEFQGSWGESASSALSDGAALAASWDFGSLASLGRSARVGSRESWFQPTTALALSAGPQMRSVHFSARGSERG